MVERDYFALSAPCACLYFKDKKTRKVSLVLIFFMTFSMVLGGEIFLYLSKKEVPKQDRTPPIIKKVIQLNENVKKCTIDLFNASAKLDSLGMVQSRITDIKSALKLIEELKQLVEVNQSAIDTLIQFTDAHQAFLSRKKLSWILAIKDFYTHHHITQHQKSRNHFLAAFDSFLTYTDTNFENIMTLKSQKHMKNYDAYYLRYRSAADSHNRFNKKRISFQVQFIEEHPEVKPFLPGSHHLKPFRFWDKFSF